MTDDVQTVLQQVQSVAVEIFHFVYLTTYEREWVHSHHATYTDVQSFAFGSRIVRPKRNELLRLPSLPLSALSLDLVRIGLVFRLEFEVGMSRAEEQLTIIVISL